jgi:transposase
MTKYYIGAKLKAALIHALFQDIPVHAFTMVEHGISNKRKHLIIAANIILESTNGIMQASADDDVVNDMILSQYRPIGKWGAYTIQRRILGFIFDQLGNRMWEYGEGSRKRDPALDKIFTKAKQETGAGPSNRTIRRWFNHFLKYGETPEQTRRFRKKFSVRYSRSFTAEDTEALMCLVDSAPELYLDEIQDVLRIERGKAFRPTSIWREIHRNGYSLQVATNRASQRDADERRQYQQVLHAIVESPDQLVFIDETHKSRNEARRRRHWSPRGRTPFRDVAFQGSHDPRYTMIAACDVNGFILESCDVIERERGRSDKDETRGTVDRERFELWVEECLVPVLGNYADGEKRSIVVLDNASVHHGARVIELIEGAGAYILYTAPYSPDRNPIELMFNQYKMGLKRHCSSMHWFEAHLKAVHSVTPGNARNYFRHCGVPGCSNFADDDDDHDIETTFFIMTALLDPIPILLALDDDFPY